MMALDADDLDHRADASLREDVIQALGLALHVPAELRVGVQDGIVHLAGRLPSLDLWESAAVAAARVPGVRGVVNRIEAPGAPTPARMITLDLDNEEDHKRKSP